MDAELLLLGKIVAENDLKPVLDSKITPDFFADPDHRAVFEWMLKYWARYGKVPGNKAVKNNFPDYQLVNGREPYEFYLDEVRGRYKYNLTYSLLQEAAEPLEEDETEEALEILRRGMLQIDTEVTELRDTNIVETWEQRLEQYENWRQFSGRLRGIPSGFPTIDETLRGFQEEQLITFIGVPKVGKSTMLMRMAIEAHKVGRVPLFIGFEMSNEEQEARHDSMISGVSYPKLLAGKLDDSDTERLRKRLKSRRSMQEFILSSDTEGATVSGVAAKIEQYRPDIIFIDGVYMMDDEEGEPKGSPQALTNLTRSLKRLARRTRLPIVISTQVLTWKVNRRRGIDMNSIGYSSSFAQDSDVILGVEHTSEDEDDPVKKVSIIQARSAPRRSVQITWNWEKGQFTEMSEDVREGTLGVEDEEDDD